MTSLFRSRWRNTNYWNFYLLGAKNGKKLRYDGLKGCTDYKKAVQIIKDGGYATSLTYVEKLCSIIEKWNLTQIDVQDSGGGEGAVSGEGQYFGSEYQEGTWSWIQACSVLSARCLYHCGSEVREWIFSRMGKTEIWNRLAEPWFCEESLTE